VVGQIVLGVAGLLATIVFGLPAFWTWIENRLPPRITVRLDLDPEEMIAPDRHNGWGRNSNKRYAVVRIENRRGVPFPITGGRLDSSAMPHPVWFQATNAPRVLEPKEATHYHFEMEQLGDPAKASFTLMSCGWSRTYRFSPRAVTGPLRPSLIFGVPAKWEAFHRRNVSFLDAWTRLHTLLERVFVRNLTDPSQVDLHVLYLGRLCVEDFAEVLLVCGNGYGIAGKKLLRGLFERALTACYLHKHPDEAPNFEDYWHVKVHELAGDVREVLGPDAVSDEALAELKSRADAVRERFTIGSGKKKRLQHSWTRLGVAAMARECPEIGEYFLPAYRDTLSHVHANFGGIILRLGMAGEAIAFQDESSPEECDQVLVTAHALLLRVLELQVAHFKLEGLDADLAKCVEDFTTVWKRQPDPSRRAPDRAGREPRGEG
jgi:hypothetical protein